MPGDRIIIDGLWRILCPSIDILSLSKPLGLWQVPRVRPAPPLAVGSTHTKCCQLQGRRQYSQASTPREHETNPVTRPDSVRAAYLKRLAKRSPWIPGAVFQDLESLSNRIDEIPTGDIYALLKQLHGTEGAYVPITRLVDYLVRKRGERPNAALYESLIKANIDPRYGSAKVAAQILQEVKSHSIPTTPELYHAFLEVTAVHPDYVLRGQVLHEMKTRWYTTTPRSEVIIIIGHLRDGQYELALSKLEELNKFPINVPPWLFDIFLYTFGELGFHEETLSILRHRQRLVDILKRPPLSLNAWQFLLDVFSRDAFQPGIKFVWDHWVGPGYVHPPDGVVSNVLNAASMHGDMALAMGAIQELSARGVKLSMHHYEALIHVHMQQNDLQKAMTVLCIMAKAGLNPDLASTRPIFQLLHPSPMMTNKALGVLHELKVQYTVPAAAFNVVLESTAVCGGFRIAFDLYRTIRQVCINGPDIETFETLFRYCTQRKPMRVLVAEMEVFSLKPTQSILDHLIRICLIQDDYGMAFRYLELMNAYAPPISSDRMWMSKSSALALLQSCIRARDSRVHTLIEQCRLRHLLDEEDIKSLVSAGEQNAGLPQTQPSSLDSHGQEDLISSAGSPVPISVSTHVYVQG